MSRLIDKLPTPTHLREKRVIVTAATRTGTFSLYQALNKLGYKTYSLFEVHSSPIQLDLFEEALKAKYCGIGKPYGKEEFDKWLANYDALIEIPAFFPEEMIAAYPDAKFVHIERDVDKWLNSMAAVFTSVESIVNSPVMDMVALYDPFVKSFIRVQKTMSKILHHDMSAKDSRAIKFLAQDYIQLAITVKTLVPEENLACFSLEDTFGWEQICFWLDKPIPQEPYPRGNAPEEYDALMGAMLKPNFKKFGVLTMTAIALPACSLGAWYYGLNT